MKGDRIDIIIGKMKPMMGKSEDAPMMKTARMPDKRQSSDFIQEVDMDEKTMAEEMAAEELITAIKQADATAVNEALKNWHSICYGPSPDELEESLESEEEAKEGEY